MAKKKKSVPPPHISGDFSPKVLSQLYAKESELKLSSHRLCVNPYKMLDYSPLIYMDILEALNKRYCKNFRPVNIREVTVTNSSDYADVAGCILFPFVSNGEMFVIIESNDYNKATYGLKIQKSLYLPIVAKLKEFFSGTQPNKRSSFSGFIQTLDGVIDVKRFAHTTSRIWEQRIKQFIKLSPMA